MTLSAKRVLWSIRNTFQYLNEETFLLLYKSLVRPLLEYAQEVWHCQLVMDIISVESVQRRATKLLPALRNLPYSDRLRQLHLPTLVHRRRRGDQITTFKLVHGLNVTEKPLFTLNISRQTRGHSLKLNVTRANKTLRSRFFGLRVVKDWNALPEHVVTAPSVNAFKSRLDKHWQNQESMYDFRALR